MLRLRPLDLDRDITGVVALLGQERATGGIWHPGGGAQWLLRQLGDPDFEAEVAGDQPGVEGFLLIDGTVAVPVARDIASRLALMGRAEDWVRSRGSPAIETSTVEGDPLQEALEQRGYRQSEVELELMLDLDAASPEPVLPAGFTFGSLLDSSDDAYIELHRASWSDTRPSPYRRELHYRVRSMPQFRPELVTIAFSPDGTPAASCIGWFDPMSDTLEIEPLGTHRAFRRLGLARAVVDEAARRARQAGARDVLVWNNPRTNAPAYRLYTSAGMTPRRRIAVMRREL
jgi:GNAT superfamily N-acetyltransferase